MTTPANPIRCPNCQNPIQAQIEQLFDVGHDPALKARLLSGNINFVQCKICGYQGQVAAPIVYHDPEKELLLSYVPVELGLSKDDQERVLGRLINQAINRLEPKQRKGYLFQPQSALTFQGLIEKILEADGVTKEQIESQRAKLHLFEELLRTPEEEITNFVSEHDDELDESFFQIASLSLQTTSEGPARQAATQQLENVLLQSSYGKKLQAQEAEYRAAAETLQQEGESLTRERLLEIFIEASNEDRIRALTQLSRPALDYNFFQKLTERIEATNDPQKQDLIQLRDQLLKITQEIDQAQQARATQAANMLKSLMEAEDLDQAIRAALPAIDELFLGILQANLRAAREKKDLAGAAKLEEIDRRIHAIIRASLPPGLKLIQEVMEENDPDKAREILEANAEQIDEEALNALLATAQRLETRGSKEAAARMRQLHKDALRLSMRAKMNSKTGEA